MSVLVTAADLAAEWRRTERYVRGLVKQGMPKEAHGKYDVDKCRVWLIRYLQDKIAHRDADGEAGPDDYSADREHARLVKSKADRAEFELAEKRGLLIPLSAFSETMTAMITQARQQLLQMPARVAPTLEGEPRHVIKHKLTLAVHQSLTALAEDDHAIGNDNRKRAAAKRVEDDRRGIDGPEARNAAVDAPVGTAADVDGDGMGREKPRIT